MAWQHGGTHRRGRAAATKRNPGLRGHKAHFKQDELVYGVCAGFDTIKEPRSAIGPIIDELGK